MTVAAGLKRIVLTPLHVLQLATSAKSFLDHPLIGSARLNRMGLHRGRVRLADMLCRWRRRRLANETVENSRKRCWAKAVMRMVTVVMIPMGAALQERCCLCEI